MHQVRLARGAGLAFVVFQGIVVGFLDNGQIVLRTGFLNPLHQLAELGERKSGGRDLLAQARHVGLYPAERSGSERGRAGTASTIGFERKAGTKWAMCSNRNILLLCSNWNILCI